MIHREKKFSEGKVCYMRNDNVEMLQDICGGSGMKMRVKGFFLLACPMIIALLYLHYECFYDPKDVFYYIYPAAIHSIMILLTYLVYKSYAKEKSRVIVCILLSGIAVIVPFADRTFRRYDWVGMMFEFAWFL